MKQKILSVSTALVLWGILAGSAGASLGTHGDFENRSDLFVRDTRGDMVQYYSARDDMTLVNASTSFRTSMLDQCVSSQEVNTSGMKIRYEDVLHRASEPYLYGDCLTATFPSESIVCDGCSSVSHLWESDPAAQGCFHLLEACEVYVNETDTWVVLDNMMAEASLAPVPEPSTILLVGSGLISVGIMGRWRSRRKMA